MSVKQREAQTGRRRMTPAQRRANLVETALAVFADKGYRATSMSEIAQAAGVHRSILYDRFPSKRALFLNVLQEQHVLVLTFLGASLSPVTVPRDRIRAVIDGFFRYAEEHTAGRAILFDLTAEDDVELRIIRWGIAESRTRAMAFILGPDLQRLGVAPESDLACLRVETFLAALNGLAQRWEQERDLTRTEIADIAFRVLWQGLLE